MDVNAKSILGEEFLGRNTFNISQQYPGNTNSHWGRIRFQNSCSARTNLRHARQEGKKTCKNDLDEGRRVRRRDTKTANLLLDQECRKGGKNNCKEREGNC